jgi:hypothetical protein
MGGFCGARIQPDCLRIDSSGVVRVSLSVPAHTWFETLASFGDVLHLTRAPAAVLGQLGEMPAVQDWRNQALPRSRSGLFAPNLAEYASLWAVRETSPLGVLHGFEVRDVSGTVFERVLLPDDARLELFHQFVAAYQSPPEGAGHWFPPNHAWSSRRRSSLAARVPWLRSRWASGDRNVRRLPSVFIPNLLTAVGRTKLPIRTTHYHPALMRTVLWTPHVCADAAQGGESVEFFPGDGVGLHLNRPAIASVWLWRGECSCCAERRWSVEISDARDHIAFALMAGDETDESEWRASVDSCLP